MSFTEHWAALTEKYPRMFAEPDRTIAQLFYRWGCVDTWNEAHQMLKAPPGVDLPVTLPPGQLPTHAP